MIFTYKYNGVSIIRWFIEFTKIQIGNLKSKLYFYKTLLIHEYFYISFIK